MRRALGAVLLLATSLAPPGHAEPLPLAEAIGLAVETQPSLRAADAQIAAAQARVGRAYAPYLPNINLSLQERWDGSNVTPQQTVDELGALSVSYPWANSFRSVLSLSLDERLFDFGRTGGAVASARANVAQARFDREALSRDVSLAVYQAYTEALRGYALERVQQLGVEQVERQLQRARALYKATLRPEIDVLSAETQLAQARIRLFQAHNQAQTALVALRQAIGDRAPPQLEVVDSLAPPLALERFPPAVLLDEAMRRRSEVRSSQWQIQSSLESLRAARADYFPVFSLSANANTAVFDTRFGPNVTAFGLFTITEPLFSGFSTRNAVREARANLEAARANLEVLRLRIGQEVSSAQLAVELARESLSVAEVARRQAERQLTLAKARYETKVGTFVELNDARNGLVSAMSTEVDARYTLSRSRGELRRRCGYDVVEKW